MDMKDFAMLLALESNPLMTTKELASKINVSWPTTKKRYQEISDKGIVRSPLGIYNPEALGLRRISTFLNPTKHKGLLNLEKVVDEFPYIHYRARTTSNKIGLFVQFDIPEGEIAFKHLSKFLQSLVDNETIEKFNPLESLAIRFEAYPKLAYFSLETLTWNFSWEEWFENMDLFSTQLPEPKELKNNFEEFTQLRFKILKALTYDASIKQAELMEEYNLSRTDAHRHYSFVKSNFIHEVRLNYNREYFELTETYAVILEDISTKEQGRLYNQVLRNPPPFRFAIDILKGQKVLLWGNMSLNQVNSFIVNLWKRFDKLEIFRLNTRDDGAALYYFYPSNFDFDSMNWKTSYDYMVKDPFKLAVEKHLKNYVTQ